MKKEIEVCENCEDETEWLQTCEICNKDYCYDCIDKHFNDEHKEMLIKLWKEYNDKNNR